MKNLQLWLIRHGATEWALNGRHTGSTDLPLLPQGEKEATALAPLLKDVAFVAVLSSPLQRAQRTCALAGLGMSAEILPELIEWGYGKYEGITTAEIRQTVPKWNKWSGLPGLRGVRESHSREEPSKVLHLLHLFAVLDSPGVVTVLRRSRIHAVGQPGGLTEQGSTFVEVSIEKFSRVAMSLRGLGQDCLDRKSVV